MNTYSLCALSALVAVPALVQPAAAEDAATSAKEFVDAVLAIQTGFAQVCIAVDTEKATPAEGAAAIAELNTAVEAMMAALPTAPEEVQAAIGALLADEAVAAQLGELEAAVLELKAALEGEDYYGDAAFKAACVKFFELNK